MEKDHFDEYVSPFSWRYGSTEMRQIWSEMHKRNLWRYIWTALAQVQAEYGLVTPAQLNDLKKHAGDIDLPRAWEIETEIHHDLMAELKTFAEQCTIGGGILHLGATSMDIEDNADALRIHQSLELIINAMHSLLGAFAEQVRKWADTPIIAYTHIQPAEPSTLGYRLAFHAQDLLIDFNHLWSLKAGFYGKGFKGAVGTGASYIELVGEDHFSEFENRLSRLLGLSFYSVTHQTYPRKQEYDLLCALAGLGATLSKFAFDLRLMQSPSFGELSEPFGRNQVGSSAMPFKRNPIQSEKINSLARMLAQLPRQAWDNASLSLLERTLDDSANRRTVLPEGFLLCDEIIHTAAKIIAGLKVNEGAIQNNLAIYGPFAATEKVLMAAVAAGADRQDLHALLREHALTAWAAVQKGKKNPLESLLLDDPVLLSFLSRNELKETMDIRYYLGVAPQKALEMADEIERAITVYNKSQE